MFKGIKCHNCDMRLEMRSNALKRRYPKYGILPRVTNEV